MTSSIQEELEELQIKERLDQLLSSIRPVITKVEGRGDISLYLLDGVKFNSIVMLDRLVRGTYASRGLDTKDPFRDFAKIITPSKKVLPADVLSSYKYSIRIKHLYKNISSEEKVLEHAEDTLWAWAKTKKRDLIQQIDQNDYGEDFIQKLQSELDAEINEATDSLYGALENKKDYEIIITNFEEKLMYAVLYHTDQKGKNTNTFLRQEVPNILFYEEDLSRANDRGDENMKKFIKSSKRIAGTIYIKENK